MGACLWTSVAAVPQAASRSNFSSRMTFYESICHQSKVKFVIFGHFKEHTATSGKWFCAVTVVRWRVWVPPLYVWVGSVVGLPAWSCAELVTQDTTCLHTKTAGINSRSHINPQCRRSCDRRLMGRWMNEWPVVILSSQSFLQLHIFDDEIMAPRRFFASVLQQKSASVISISAHTGTSVPSQYSCSEWMDAVCARELNGRSGPRWCCTGLLQQKFCTFCPFTRKRRKQNSS